MINKSNLSRAKIPASMRTDKKGSRGGKREGAGAKIHSDLGGKIMRSYRLAPDVIAILDAHRPASQTIEKAVREYAKRLEHSAKNQPTEP